jgi:hypothetical protein
MKINPIHSKQTRGFIIITVMILCAASLLILAGILSYTTTTANLNMRSNEYSLCQNAAEAATEKVYAKMAYDFVNSGGVFTVSNNVANGTYQALVPTAADNSYFTNFNFYNPTSTTAGQIYVAFLTNYAGPLPSQYTNEFAATNSMIYRIVANVTMPGAYANNANKVIGTAQEDVLFALVPINTYAIFYNGELEFSDCATMNITGRTHSNADICTGSGSALTFSALVTASTIIQSPNRGNAGPWSFNQNVTYSGGSQTDSVSVQLAIPMINTHTMIEIPTNQSPAEVATLQGQQAEYNQAQVVLIITNSPNTITNSANYAGTNPMVQVILQAGNNQSLPGADTSPHIFYETNMSPSMLGTNYNAYQNTFQIGNSNFNPYTNFIRLPFLSLTNTFTDERNTNSYYRSNMYVTQIDVGAYANWLLTNTTLTAKLTNGAATILYVADQRYIGTNKMAVVRLVNATQLPYNNNIGWTMATQNPLYVEGNYNVTTNSSMSLTLATAVGSTTNGNTVPAALLCDALTVLSSNWSDSLSSGGYTSRHPLNTTINAAVVTGNVPSTGTSATTFSGGVHNLTRLLEDWSGYTLTYNTSIVCLFSSQMATNQFQMPGSYYDPPTRNWGFDPTFYNPAREPPGIPEALVPIRFNWLQPPPGSVITGIN